MGKALAGCVWIVCLVAFLISLGALTVYLVKLATGS